MQKQHYIFSVLQTLDKQQALKIQTILRQSDKQLISKRYQGLTETFPDVTHHVKQKYEVDLGNAIDDGEWIQT